MSTEETSWLEKEAISGLQLTVWQLIFVCCGTALCVVILLCCCFRFRIPRTKQDIEADYQRRKIAKKFRDRLSKIQNSEFESEIQMDLQKALERVKKDVQAGREAEEKLQDIVRQTMKPINNGKNKI